VTHQTRRTRRAPDFENLKTVFMNGVPVDVPLYEVLVDTEVMEASVGHQFPREPGPLLDDALIEFYFTAGYDYVPTGPSIPLRHQRESVDERQWQIEHGGLVQSRQDFDEFPWPDPRDVDYEAIERISGVLPDGMQLIAQCDGI
jgi:hypothetical protein